MIRDLKPYPDYRDSGVPWLGEVPEHWGVLRLRNVAEMRVSSVDKHTEDDEQPVRLCNYVDVYKNDRIRDRMTFMHATASVDEIERFRLQIGDVLITKDSEAWNDIGVPALVEESANDLVCGYHLALLRPFRDRLYGDYLLRALQSTAVSYQFHIEANGVTRYGLSHAAIKSIWLPLPSLPEQSTIVRFLDHIDRCIRRSIHAKQKLIKLLEEQKQAIIHQAVTRGLDPNVRLKPSGVEWLGEVPEHWEIVAFRLRYNQCLGKMLDSKRIKGEHSVRYLRNQDVQWDWINTSDLPVMDIAPEEYERYTLKSGDLLVCEGGEVGRCAIWQGDSEVFGFQKALHRLRPHSMILDEPRFMYYLLIVASRSGAFADGHESTIAHLTGDKLRKHRFPFPPKFEQSAIVHFLDGIVATIDHATTATKREIYLLLEYRTRLIADIVTGKLDVRAAAACLPDEAEEPEPLDDADILTEGDEPTEGADLEAVAGKVEA